MRYYKWIRCPKIEKSPQPELVFLVQLNLMTVLTLQKYCKFDKTLVAITEFGKSYPQQGLCLLKSCYMSNLSRVPPLEIPIPFLQIILDKVRNSIDKMIIVNLSDEQWAQCCLKKGMEAWVLSTFQALCLLHITQACWIV